MLSQFFYSLTLFISASLLFVIQPMVAKKLLPVYGGTPAVWTICVLFFQAFLLIAYGYAWFLSRLQNGWQWRFIHTGVVLLCLTLLPILFASSQSNDFPDLNILKDLLFQLGLPILIIGSSAPLLQFAYSQTSAKHAKDPYFLYVASNVGSLLALLAYPWVIERLIGLTTQFYLWNALFIIYLILLMCLLYCIPFNKNSLLKVPAVSIAGVQKLKWVFLSFIPCSLMLGVTFFITTDIAATPLFWVLPLALYLLSYIITFAKKPIISHGWIARNALYFFIAPAVGFILGSSVIGAVSIIAFYLIHFFIVALLCHGELIKERPSSAGLTVFYVCLAVGGVLAGLFNGLMAPRIFNNAYEYPIVLVLSTLCIPFALSRRLNAIPLVVLFLLLVGYYLPDLPYLSWIKKNHFLEVVSLILIFSFPKSRLNLCLSMGVLFVFFFIPQITSLNIITQQRNFYGIKKVLGNSNLHVLMSQTTLHGLQIFSLSPQEQAALAYYAPIAPIVQNLQKEITPLRVAIIGVGAGILSCQFRPTDQLQLIDIDEQVIHIAQNPQFFTYLKNCASKAVIIKNDGRLALQNMPDKRLKLLIIDAFSSDAIPIHLLTEEAFRLYRKKIVTQGIILIHISNRHLNLSPVILAAAHQFNWIALDKFSLAEGKIGQYASEWMLLTLDASFARKLMQEENWHFVANQQPIHWTDEYSNLIPLLKWG